MPSSGTRPPVGEEGGEVAGAHTAVTLKRSKKTLGRRRPGVDRSLDQRFGGMRLRVRRSCVDFRVDWHSVFHPTLGYRCLHLRSMSESRNGTQAGSRRVAIAGDRALRTGSPRRRSHCHLGWCSTRTCHRPDGNRTCTRRTADPCTQRRRDRRPTPLTAQAGPGFRLRRPRRRTVQ